MINPGTPDTKGILLIAVPVPTRNRAVSGGAEGRPGMPSNISGD